MIWLQLEFLAPHSDIESIEETLEHLGALSVTLLRHNAKTLIANGDDTAPLSDSVKVQALFDEHEEQQTLLNTFEHYAPSINPLNDTDWQANFKQHFQPIHIQDRLSIYPVWHEHCDPHAILIDPGLAFGTGSHPTTHLCLELLAETVKHGDHVIDMGCGSGILSISALKLGAKQVDAVDIDPEAIAKTQQNADLNHITADALKTHLTVEQLKPAEIVVANILADVLISLKNTLFGLLKPGGTLILSGILENQREKVDNAYKSHFLIRKVAQEDGWIAVFLRKP